MIYLKCRYKPWGGHSSWLKNKLYGELISFFCFVGSSWKLGRQICDDVKVMRVLESLLSGRSLCPVGRVWEPDLWPAQLGIAAYLFELHKHLREPKSWRIEVQTPWEMFGENKKAQQPHRSRIQVQKNCLSRSVSGPVAFTVFGVCGKAGNGMSCTMGVVELWGSRGG